MTHYYVDGYNLIFRNARLSHSRDIQISRSRLISELNSLAAKLNLEITLVFDAPFKDDYFSRSHFDRLEIIYSCHGESADRLLLDLIARSRSLNCCLVTDDKALLRQAKSIKNILSHSSREFLHWLKKRAAKKEVQAQKNVPRIEPKKAVYADREAIKEIGSDTLPELGNIDAWNAIFETKYQELTASEDSEAVKKKKGLK